MSLPMNKQPQTQCFLAGSQLEIKRGFGGVMLCVVSNTVAP
jgi:hypothetical protein